MRTLLFAAMAILTSAAHADALSAHQINAQCDSLGKVASSAAHSRMRGIPKEKLQDAAAFDQMTPAAARAARAVIDATYREKWSPTEAHMKAWAVCMEAFKP